MCCFFNITSLAFPQHVKPNHLLWTCREKTNFTPINLKEVTLLPILIYFCVPSDLLGSAELFLSRLKAVGSIFSVRHFRLGF